MTSASIIIPTQGKRPDLLARAIESTRVPSGDLSIEVIVAVNGAGASRFTLPNDVMRLRQFPEFTIKVIKADTPNVGLARNLGLAASSGEIIRFLDDDDYLIGEVAYRQCMELWLSNADLSTYAGRIEDQAGLSHQTLLPGECADYGCAVLGPRCPALTFASVYRASLIRSLRWNTKWHHTEDEDWMRRILWVKDPAWICSTDVVGIWYQHSRDRLSAPHPISHYYRNRATSILGTVRMLQSEDRLTGERKTAAARGLWSAIHGGFYFSPMYWTRIARQATRLDPSFRSNQPLLQLLPRWFPPILVEWLVLPKRWLNQVLRLTRGYLLGWNNVRKIP